jgi:hypothetical protein
LLNRPVHPLVLQVDFHDLADFLLVLAFFEDDPAEALALQVSHLLFLAGWLFVRLSVPSFPPVGVQSIEARVCGASKLPGQEPLAPVCLEAAGNCVAWLRSVLEAGGNYVALV